MIPSDHFKQEDNTMERMRLPHLPAMAGTYMKDHVTQNQGGLPWWLSGKESACKCRRHRFDP